MSLTRWSVLFLLPALGSIACSAPPPAADDSGSAKRETDDSDDEDTADKTSKDESELKKTAEPVGEGQRCGGTDGATCKSGLSCIKASGSTSGTCRAPGEDGDACGGDEGRTCKDGLTCRSTKSDGEGTCGAAQGEEGDVCGGTEKLTCKSGLTCVRSSNSTNAEGLCEQEDDESSGQFCAELSRCCNQLGDMFTRLSCVAAVSAGNDTACGVSLVSFCGGGGGFGFEF